MAIDLSRMPIFRNTTLRFRRSDNLHIRNPKPGESNGILSHDLFARLLHIELKRSERSGKSFILLLAESPAILNAANDGHALDRVLSALATSIRETDIHGWHEEGTAIGVIFTELGDKADGHLIGNALLARTATALKRALGDGQAEEIRLSFRVLPEDWSNGSPVEELAGTIQRGSGNSHPATLLARAVKRSMDITGSLIALTLGLPLFLSVALAVRLTSSGPVLFLQQRVGQNGKKFGFLKFRSMYVDSDETIHREYTRSLIANANREDRGPTSQTTYKMTGDPRITPIGHFLRKTSLDELPQFVNVLKGEMSLVGPRPPLPYEVECYQAWHRRRLLVAKPGITGLWQVEGRSRVKFDEMVRMDLRYANSWSIWMDIKILLQTPKAVFSANGAH